jgi:hypothetical protein
MNIPTAAIPVHILSIIVGRPLTVWGAKPHDFPTILANSAGNRAGTAQV